VIARKAALRQFAVQEEKREKRVNFKKRLKQRMPEGA
jgi:hypothetical protein